MLDSVGTPDCAVCGRPVEEMERIENVLELTTTLVVRCHGATQRMKVTPELLLSGHVLGWGKAFETPELPPDAREIEALKP